MIGKGLLTLVGYYLANANYDPSSADPRPRVCWYKGTCE
jgi:hypothetical protein